ncbi:MOSC domain-containing protein [Leucobacter sp. CSA2]|uniref:MOSC domain-containing protein n=1 Tax=Leucobacter edaphi TaxID=2796472 RepID=A0A934QDQ2_9MICO|nr:MOSC N-terminal beta barrel domain-containing protein [Leucobacter edaphi]MBK0421177.1 MOSC domain-containing protein [Leucobacter edaphi]
MAQVAALYRFPVKGFTQESVDELVIQEDGRVRGDRAFAFRFANGLEPREREGMRVWAKSKGLTRMEFPSLARLRLRLDTEAERIRIDGPDGPLVEADLSPAGREQLAEAVTAFLRGSEDGDQLARPGRLPLTLLGEVAQSEFQDSARGYVSMHGRGSLAALGEALGREISDHRFRSNIAVDGLAPWEEIGELSGVRIGEVEFVAEKPIGRCLNTHANPETGVRDAEVLSTLTRVFGQPQPTFGHFLLPRAGGGTIRVGDTVELL